MADGSLTYAEFVKLSESARRKQYVNLSDADKFRVRQGMVSTAGPYIPCNHCKFRTRFICSAYPEGIPVEHMKALIDDRGLACGDGFHFTPEDGE